MFGARGRVGNLVVFKNFGSNQTVISRLKRKVKNPVYTNKQEEVKYKFKEAVIYARGIVGDPDLLAFYQKFAKPGTSAYNLALADFCKAPEIRLIDTDNYLGQIGDKIRARVIDNFRVMAVKISIYDASDTLIESGLAILAANSVDWLYETTLANGNLAGTKIVAEATDMPGNTTSKTVVI
ncbi:hypothetical protein EZ428_15535 [Pedobacter frigiditerrae]|uniref:Uncharacterized protein n=1 Tax=Pedobacter frigiditerrae TaxID=2530452 RepID=A0A4R0MSD0_9SPHI|nr:hypothetical protein [Pedobacter frigiditerrae]TCC89112.1 hypothetical protein EZ428_15535 [Pedobacter frigiditerrae]